LASAALGAVSTITMPVFGALFDLERYDAAFLFAAACPIAGYGLWLWLTAEPAPATLDARSEAV
jgi:hypothetical protein